MQYAGNSHVYEQVGLISVWNFTLKFHSQLLIRKWQASNSGDIFATPCRQQHWLNCTNRTCDRTRNSERIYLILERPQRCTAWHLSLIASNNITITFRFNTTIRLDHTGSWIFISLIRRRYNNYLSPPNDDNIISRRSFKADNSDSYSIS